MAHEGSHRGLIFGLGGILLYIFSMPVARIQNCWLIMVLDSYHKNLNISTNRTYIIHYHYEKKEIIILFYIVDFIEFNLCWDETCYCTVMLSLFLGCTHPVWNSKCRDIMLLYTYLSHLFVFTSYEDCCPPGWDFMISIFLNIFIWITCLFFF